MKMNWIVLSVILTASMAWAQTATGTKTGAKQTTPFSKKSTASAKTTAPKITAKTTAPKTVKTTASKMKSKPATAAVPKAAAPKVAKPKAVKKAKPATAPAAPTTAAVEPSTVPGPGRKRDPFISPVQARLEGLAPGCSTGKRCLAVNEIVLRGIVRSPNGMIAVVENAAQKTYFLHENDPIYNGFVERITPESVIFKEHYVDNLGHDSQREVVKTVNAPVV